MDDEFEEIDFSVNKAALVGLETIALSVRRGEHYVLAKRSVIFRLCDDASLSEHARGVFQSLRGEYAFIAERLKSFRFRVTVSVAGELTRVSKMRWIIPVTLIANKGLSESILLAENSDDADMYTHAARHYQVHEKISGIQIKITPRNGNGAGIYKELGRVVEQEREFCLCVTDSDRLYPGANLGENGSKCEKTLADAKWVAYHCAPVGREIENVILFKLIIEAAEKNNAKHCDAWLDGMKLIGDEPSLYADLKYGTSLRNVFSHAEKSRARFYWNKVIDKLPTIRQSKCNGEGECSAAKEEKCQCSVVPALGENIANHVRKVLGDDGPHATYKRAKSSTNFDDWLRLGQDVFEIAAAPKPMRL
ncbi:hypothetical protein FOZ70_19725 [Burkholderia sp. COPS]|uniref:hypothetical protein n=1 Tax=Burkholderia sp. COPS TaxID=2597663 RepID=UPI001CA5B9DA|nr:hypothetical protein [Burkholderia sp. COPS]MBW5806968.1 hypothetical protein [Burkholderia sp. COPS]